MTENTVRTKGGILLFAGTTEGRELAAFLVRRQIPFTACVATPAGAGALPESPFCRVRTGRLDAGEMEELMRAEGTGIAVDATHPYAALVSENIRAACRAAGCEYVRLRRAAAPGAGHAAVEDISAAVQFLAGTEGNILAAAGSSALEALTALPGWKERVWVRLLPVPEALEAASSLGYSPDHLILMQGPFGEELNTAMLRQVDAAWMLTKESGRAGGFPEKERAAAAAGARLVVIGRPPEAEEGLDALGVRDLLCRRLGLRAEPSVTLAGIGPGGEGAITPDVQKACREADILLGARRMLQAVPAAVPKEEAWTPAQISACLAAHPAAEKVVVLLSGDPGFYSGAKRILEETGAGDIRVLPGISSVAALCAQLKMSWEDAALVSLHGREGDIIGAVRTKEKVFTLMDGPEGLKNLCGRLAELGLGRVRVDAGFDLSYPSQKILSGTPEEVKAQLESGQAEGICCALIRNPAPDRRVAASLADEEFTRGRVPMTSREVRTAVLAALELQEDSILYDIGAGTGSVSVEAGRLLQGGRVFAIEKNPEGIGLIRENCRRHSLDNVQIVEGTAPEALADLPAPACAFVGGSGGQMEAILRALLQKNPAVRIVATAICLETAGELTRLTKCLPVKDVQIVSLTAARAREAGGLHLMMGQNPVYIFSFTGGEA